MSILAPSLSNMSDLFYDISGVNVDLHSEASLAETLGEPINAQPFCELIGLYLHRKKCVYMKEERLLSMQVICSDHSEETAKDLLMTVEQFQLPAPAHMAKRRAF